MVTLSYNRDFIIVQSKHAPRLVNMDNPVTPLKHSTAYVQNKLLVPSIAVNDFDTAFTHFPVITTVFFVEVTQCSCFKAYN